MLKMTFIKYTFRNEIKLWLALDEILAAIEKTGLMSNVKNPTKQTYNINIQLYA